MSGGPRRQLYRLRLHRQLVADVAVAPVAYLTKQTTSPIARSLSAAPERGSTVGRSRLVDGSLEETCADRVEDRERVVPVDVVAELDRDSQPDVDIPTPAEIDLLVEQLAGLAGIVVDVLGPELDATIEQLDPLHCDRSTQMEGEPNAVDPPSVLAERRDSEWTQCPPTNRGSTRQPPPVAMELTLSGSCTVP